MMLVGSQPATALSIIYFVVNDFSCRGTLRNGDINVDSEFTVTFSLTRCWLIFDPEPRSKVKTSRFDPSLRCAIVLVESQNGLTVSEFESSFDPLPPL